MAQQPRHPEEHPNPTHPGSQPGQSQQQNPASSQGQAQQGQPGAGGKTPEPGEPGSQRLSPPAGGLHPPKGPPPERPGMVRPYPGERQSIFENQPGQQIVGQPAHEGYEEDRQHLRGRTVQEGSAAEDKEPKPRGVPKGAIFAGKMGSEKPDAPPLPTPGEGGEEGKEGEEQGPQHETAGGRR